MPRAAGRLRGTGGYRGGPTIGLALGRARIPPMEPLVLLTALLSTTLPSATPPSLSQARPPAGEVVALFDGRSLQGWVTRGGRYDGDARWSVEDGCIVGRQGPGGEGGLLYTEKPHTSFELQLEVKLDHPFDSGVFLRMAPQGKGAQVTLDWREEGEIGAIYSDGFLQHNPGGAAQFRRDEWNELEVRCTGFDMHIRVRLNGKELVDYELPAGSPGYAPTGLIGLQVHGERGDTGAARFRNIRLRELPVFADALLVPHTTDPQLLAAGPGARDQGWRLLFDGKTLENWSIEGDSGRYRAENGVLSFLAQGGGGHLFTTEDFQDFRLRLDFRTAQMANSGLFLRAARDGSNPAFSGCEVQILDDFNWESVSGSKLKPWQFSGSLYGAVPPGDRNALHALGEWNTYEVLYQGPRLAVALNGHTLYDVDTYALVPESGEPFAKRATTGFIGLQHHGAENVNAEVMAAFRNVFVQRL